MVYFIVDGSGKNCKIGFTTDIEKRHYAIQHAHGDAINVMYLCEGSVVDEKILHKALGHYRKMGEWFEYNIEVEKVFTSYFNVSDKYNKSRALMNIKKEAFLLTCDLDRYEIKLFCYFLEQKIQDGMVRDKQNETIELYRLDAIKSAQKRKLPIDESGNLNTVKRFKRNSLNGLISKGVIYKTNRKSMYRVNPNYFNT
jgi:hypothetical protein